MHEIKVKKVGVELYLNVLDSFYLSLPLVFQKKSNPNGQTHLKQNIQK